MSLNDTFKRFVNDEKYRGNLSWYVFCLQYKVFNRKILKFVLKNANSTFAIIDVFLLKLLKIRLKSITKPLVMFINNEKSVRDLEITFLLIPIYLGFLEIIKIFPQEIRVLVLSIAFTIYTTVPPVCLFYKTFKFRSEKYQIGKVWTIISIIYTLLRVVLTNSRVIVLSIAFCLYSSIVTIMAIEVSLDIIKDVVLDQGDVNSYFKFILVYSMFIFIPTTYQHQDFLEKIDPCWKKVKFEPYGVFFIIIWLGIFIVSVYYFAPMNEELRKEFKGVVRLLVILITFFTYIAFILTNSYKAYRLNKKEKS